MINGIKRKSAKPRNKAELMERIDRSWLALEQVVAQFDQEGMIARPPEGWSVKDHLAHISAWDEAGAAMLTRRPRHEALGVDEQTYARGADAINDVIYRLNAERPLVDVLADWQSTHRHLLAALDGLSDEELRQPYAKFLPDDRLVNGRNRMLARVRLVSYSHYEDHVEWIARLKELYASSNSA